jgi:hypothetical protein
MVMMVLSLGMSTLERILSSEKHFIRVPQITWPLICLAVVVVFTAKLTGGFGFRALGSAVYGGKKYVNLMAGILTYFAFTAQRISPKNARLYASLFLLGGVTAFVGDFYPITPPSLRYIYMFFPPSVYGISSFEVGETRLFGVSGAGATFVGWLMARYGLRGIFLSGKGWRPVLFVLASLMIFLGGFRIKILSYVFILGVLFYLEGLHRTKWLLVFLLAGLLGAVAIVPLAPHLPFTAQRTLAFLPLDISPEARLSADNSSQWRIDMWKALLPQIPPHLLLGKGCAISMEDYQFMGNTAFRAVDESQQGLALAGDYHNGPLSVIIPFGIWGVIVFLWVVIAGMRVLYCNFRHGAASLRTVNTYFWVLYLYIFLRFLFVYGSFTDDMMFFASTIGFSIALNGGVCRPVTQPVQASQSMAHLAKRIVPRVRPAFQR